MSNSPKVVVFLELFSWGWIRVVLRPSLGNQNLVLKNRKDYINWWAIEPHNTSCDRRMDGYFLDKSLFCKHANHLHGQGFTSFHNFVLR